MIINLHFFGGGGGPSRYYEQNNPQNRRVRQLPTDGSMGIAGGWEPIPTAVNGANRSAVMPDEYTKRRLFENANRVPGGILDQLDISNPGWRKEADKQYMQIPQQPVLSKPAGPNPRLSNPREAYQNILPVGNPREAYQTILPVGNPTPLPQENVNTIEPWQRRNPNDIVSNRKGGSQYPQSYNQIQDPYRRIAGNGK